MKKFLVVLTILAVSLAGGSAFAASMRVDDDTFGRFGAKGIIRYVMTNPDATGDKVDVVAPNTRVYFSGQVTNTVKFGFNFDMTRGRTTAASSATRLNPATGAPELITIPAGTSTSTSALSDGFIMLDLMKEVKIMTGIYRMAVTRVALQDTYQYILPSSPDVAAAGFLSSSQAGGAALAGFRSAGLTLWGDLADGMIRYNVGLWDGDYAPTIPTSLTGTPGTAVTNPTDAMGMSARVVFNFLDPEKGYVCPGCYLGKAQVFNVGVGLLKWDDLGTVAAPRDYSVTTVDAFYDAHGLTGELGFFQYDYDLASGQKPKAIYLQAAYVIADKIQPAVRFETWDNDTVSAADWDQMTVGVNYLFDGHDAKVGLEVKRRTQDNVADQDTATVQLQVQF